ncbi:MAG: hypothetical protein U0572_01570 [Phycisphaerales bacterium]
MTGRRIQRIACAASIALSCARFASGAPLVDAPPVVAARGIAGTLTFTHAGQTIRARANQSLMSPVLVRVAGGAAGEYRVSFLGTVAGEFDLRDYLEYDDGRPLADVPPLRVRVDSKLPPQYGTDLFTFDHPNFALTSHYRTIAATIAVAWALVPLVVLTRRALRRAPPAPHVDVPPPPTIADQLRPLVQSAMAGSLSIADRGRLELLLYRFWRDALELGGLTPAESIGHMRHDPRAGRLIVAVERWLHSGADSSPRPDDDIAELLAPYMTAPAIELAPELKEATA